MTHVTVMLRAKPKARPRVTRKGTFMPREYQEWRKEFGRQLADATSGAQFDGPVAMYVTFHTDAVSITIQPWPSERRKHVRADIDNLLGGVLEVCEDIGLITNDRMVHRIYASVADPEVPE